jgi:hypothetical protein
MWMNGTMVFGRTFNEHDTWWDIVKLSGMVRITFEPLTEDGEFQGP